MSGERDAGGAAGRADSPADEAASKTVVRPKTDETLGLAESGQDTPASAGGDLPRLRPGEQLAGRFVVLRFIARGGMGAVYEANDVMLHTRVALKVLQGQVTADAAAMERFQREVLLARRVSHPHVCRVYEFYQSTTAGGVPIHFLTMEYLEGETLASRIARTGRLSTAEALPLVTQMCEGLAAAHAEGVIHRDFKSANVMLVQRPGDSGSATRVVITDFGIARVFEGGAEAPAPGLTGGAGILGTPEYMAPEQVTGGTVSPATDVYALGIVLYEMVTGRLPFSGETPLATAARRINEAAPRPELAAPGLDSRWSQTILRCLDRDPRRRFQNAADVPPALSKVRGRPSWLLPSAVALLLVAVLALGIRVLQRATTPAVAPAASVAAQPSIAVLAFADMSPEHNQEYFSDGLAQEIIDALAQIPGLHVAARSSSFSFKGKNEDLRTVGQKLDVANVLEGSVRKSGSHLRVTAQLVNAASGYQLWSQTFDRELADVFAVQDEISHAVVSALKLKVLPNTDAAAPRPVTNPEAYTHYLRGLQLENTGSASGLQGAVEEYRRALVLDPSYAPAHARLAWALFWYANTFGTDEQQMRQEAMAEAQRAVELDPSRGDGYLARGFLRTATARDFAGAREDLGRAVALSPGDARARTWLAVNKASFGQLPEAISAAESALQLDPLSAETRQRLGSLYNAAGQYAEARETLKKALDIAPHNSSVVRELAFTELFDGHPQKTLALLGQSDVAWMRDLGNAVANHSLGNAVASQAALQHLIANFSGGAPYQIAEVYAWRGQRDLAIEWLAKAVAGDDPGVGYINYDPFMRPLRSDPRFKAMLQSLKLPTD